MKLKIYVRNVFGVPLVSPKRKERFLLIQEELLSLKPDIVFLQEIFFKKDILLFEKILKEYSVVRSKRHIFDLGGGLVSFIHKKIKYEASYNPYAKSGFLTDLSITDKFASKGFQTLKIFDNDTHILDLIHTHLTCPYERIKYESIEQLLTSQLSQLSSFIKDTSTPLCICGDFNLEPGNNLLRNFIEKNNLTDESSSIKSTYLGNFYFPSLLFKNTTLSEKIDYILSKNIRGKILVNSLSDTKFISDHKALLIEINL
jgi:hypothetical protein